MMTDRTLLQGVIFFRENRKSLEYWESFVGL